MWRLGLALFSSGPPTLASFKLLVIAECTFLDTFRKSKRLLVSIVDEDLVIGLNTYEYSSTFLSAAGERRALCTCGLVSRLPRAPTNLCHCSICWSHCTAQIYHDASRVLWKSVVEKTPVQKLQICLHDMVAPKCKPSVVLLITVGM